MKAWTALVATSCIAACATKPPPKQIRVSGQIEATDIQVSAKVGGRVIELLASEGRPVNVGDVVARIDPTDAELAVARARAERDQAAAQLKLLESGGRPEDIRQAEAQAAAAESAAAAAEAELAAAQADVDRFEALLAQNSGSRKQRDDAVTRRDVGRQRLQSAREQVRAARETLAKLRAGARREEMAAARARVAAVDAQIAALMKSVADATIVAPASGVVTQTIVDAGELVVPNTPILIVTDLAHAWANLYVDEPLIPRLRVGQTVRIYTDAGGAGLSGTISFISPRAEFTPRNVQTADERAKLVFRVKVSTDNRDGVLKSGMPVEAEIPLDSREQ